MDARPCEVHHLGLLPFREAWALQREWVERRKAGEISDRLLLLEHPPVITLGRNSRREHLLTSPEALASEGIEVVETDRGGDVTFHGPGQLVGYLILDLSRIRKDVVWYVRTLEEAIIRALRGLEVDCFRRPGMTGVWTANGKVAAIGIHISRWVTSHGLALNVETNLDYFRHIVPCGIARCPVTSLRELLGASPGLPRVENLLVEHLADLLGLAMQPGALRHGERRTLCQSLTC
ncbi:MAG TPA: lipoyl(octanoyl) transferase LipB [Terriglobia bacterium]|nr:lipoyl(octanoyl) transferase LipB [Terriglobia bacterium]